MPGRLKDFRPYFRDFTSDSKVSKPDFRDFWSDFTDYKDFRLDFRDFRSDFRTFLHQISEVVGPLDLIVRSEIAGIGDNSFEMLAVFKVNFQGKKCNKRKKVRKEKKKTITLFLPSRENRISLRLLGSACKMFHEAKIVFFS